MLPYYAYAIFCWLITHDMMPHADTLGIDIELPPFILRYDVVFISFIAIITIYWAATWLFILFHATWYCRYAFAADTRRLAALPHVLIYFLIALKIFIYAIFMPLRHDAAIDYTLRPLAALFIADDMIQLI